MFFKFQINGNFGGQGRESDFSVDTSSNRFPKTHKILSMVYRKFFVAGILIFFFTGLQSVAHSAIYYLSPSGSNTNTGTSGAPWKTFGFAIPKLQPGDTLILKDGTYDDSNSGYPNINGSTNANNGTSQNPITVRAQNERKAFINGNGFVDAVRIANLTYWNFEGIYAQSAENHNSASGNVFRVTTSNNLQFRRLLLTYNNRWSNTHLLAIEFSNNILVEESEFYHFHRHGILNWFSNNNTYRRNYFNSRKMTDVSGGFRSTATDRGDIGISNYPGSNNIVENNISENNQAVTDVQALEAAVGNKILGNISLNEHYGVILGARGTGNKMPMNNIIRDHVSISPTYYGLALRGTKNTQIYGVTLFGGHSGIMADFDAAVPGDGVYSIFSENALTMNHASGYGIRTVSHAAWSHNYPNAYNNWANFSPSTNVTKSATLNPGFGTCRVFVPNNSPLKGKGAGGADIGANILYRYEKGMLTNQPLWNTTTGEFAHGALVPGVNDIAGSSAFDVHKRLNVNANGCTLPENYGAGGEPDLTPMNLRRVGTSG